MSFDLTTEPSPNLGATVFAFFASGATAGGRDKLGETARFFPLPFWVTGAMTVGARTGDALGEATGFLLRPFRRARVGTGAGARTGDALGEATGFLLRPFRRAGAGAGTGARTGEESGEMGFLPAPWREVEAEAEAEGIGTVPAVRTYCCGSLWSCEDSH